MLNILHYTDLKSPYAYLAFDQIMALPDTYPIELTTRPYTLDIPVFMGSVAERDPNQWRKVKYAYMDCRRQAKQRGLKLFGPTKIYDTRPINVAMLFADRSGKLPEFCRDVFKRFFEHKIEVEDPQDVLEALRRADLASASFEKFLEGEGGALHDQICVEAEEMGVFGVPSLVIEGEIFWGGDRLQAATSRIKDLI